MMYTDLSFTQASNSRSSFNLICVKAPQLHTDRGVESPLEYVHA